MTAQATSEFDRQLETLPAKGYPEILGLSERAFRKTLEPLKAKLPKQTKPLEDGYLPFAIVINSPLLSAEQALSLVDFNDKKGLEKMYPRKPEDFNTIESVQIPEGLAYLLLDIDRGAEFLNVVPAEALETIQARGRSPLTIAEGIAVLTQHPEFLKKNNCSRSWPRGTSRASPNPPTSACLRCGSARVAPSSAGAGTATRTPGWGRPPAGAGRGSALSVFTWLRRRLA